MSIQDRKKQAIKALLGDYGQEITGLITSTIIVRNITPDDVRPIMVKYTNLIDEAIEQVEREAEYAL